MRRMIQAVAVFAVAGVAAVAAEADAKAPRHVLDLTVSARNPCNGEGDFIRLKDGRILFVYTEYNGMSSNDDGAAHLVKRLSSDEGKTWTDSKTVEPEVEKGFFCYFATLVVKDGLLLHYYDKPHLIDSCVTKVPLEWIGGSKGAMK